MSSVEPANIAHGLSRADGFLTVEILLKATVLQPTALGLEHVSNFMAHAHYPIVLDVIEWLGWKVKWGCRANLLDVLPQSRERCLLTLVRKNHDLKPDFMFNTIAQTMKVSWQTTPVHIVDMAMSQRLSASRQEVLVNSATGKIEIKELLVSPTLQWSDPPADFAEWLIPIGPCLGRIRVHPGLPVARVLRFLFPNAQGGSITWRSKAFPDVQIPHC